MAAIATLKALLSLDNKAFKAGMRESTGLTKGFQSAMAQVGRTLGVAFSAAAIVQGAKAIASWAGNISEAAQNAGIATEVMMGLNRVAIQNGLELGDVSKLLAKVANTTASAARGEDEYAKKLRTVGLSYEKLITLNPAEQLQEVARAAVASGMPLEALAEIFEERLGPRAVSMLKDIAQNGLPAVSKAAGDAADSAEKLGDMFARVFDSVKTTALSVGGWLHEGMADAVAIVDGATRRMQGMGIKRLNPVEWGKAAAYSAKERAGVNASTEQTSKDKAAQESKDRTAALQREADKARAKKIADIDAETQAIADKRKGGLEKMAAEQEAIEAKLAKRMADTQDQAVRQALWRQLEASRKSYEERVKAFKESVEKEKEEVRKGAAEKKRLLAEQFATRIASTTGEGINVDSMARMGGFTGASRTGMASADRKTKLAELQVEYIKESNAIQKDTNALVKQIHEKAYGTYESHGV